MRKFLRTASRSAHLPFIQTAEETLRSFTASGRVLFFIFAGLMVASSLGLLHVLNQTLLVAVPARGGMVTEGIVGSPRFINPVLATTDADRDLATLVYSGLLKATPEGSYIPDLAADYELSQDGSVYTVILREGLTFHDGTELTAEDVAFTIAKVQDPVAKSPQRASWDGVGVEVVDEMTLRFTLKSAYAPFIKNLTLGILPAHLWGSVASEDFPWSELNTAPIGSGPFAVASVERSTSGIPVAYELKPFDGYAQGAPYLERLVLRFYQSEEAVVEALEQSNIDAVSGISPALLAELSTSEINRTPLNRVFGVFFNQNQSEVLRDASVREALSIAINREELIAAVLAGYGTPLTEPAPPSLFSNPGNLAAAAAAEAPAGDLALEAREMLVARGWEENAEGVLQKTTGKGDNEKTVLLAFSLSTSNVPELRDASELLRQTWERTGARVEVKVFEQGDLSQNVIRPRKYDALLFGEVVGRQLDLYAFWHSSQRNDPGLNIALYANSTADDALESLRETSDPAERQALYEELRAEIESDLPAVFLYAPDFVYLFPTTIRGLELGLIENPSDRFLTAHRWHVEEESVWPFFSS
jgi:peptide/nickel transport system substrate-binding protein